MKFSFLERIEFLIGFAPLSECFFAENAFGFLIGFGPLPERLVV